MSLSLKRLYPGHRWTFAIILTFILLGVYERQNQLAEGLSFQGETHFASNVRLLRDLTFVNEDQQRQSSQQIFDEIFRLIDSAQQLIVLDMFLFNEFQGEGNESLRGLSGELTGKLIAKKQTHPDISIVVISDPVNTVYGGLPSKHFDALQTHGITVVITELNQLRDSNPIYSVFWRLFIRPWGNEYAQTLPNPFGRGEVSLRSWLKLLNFKANHRKLIVADHQKNWHAIVTSANPHDGSSAHSNMAVLFDGPAVLDVLQSEAAVARLSGIQLSSIQKISDHVSASDVTVQILTESKIKAAALENIRRTESGDRIVLLMFYLSDREIIESLLAAQGRGVSVRVILDPNKDAFGRKKNGIPNRQSGAELNRAGVSVRWCDTHGEQCHSKTLLVHYTQRPSRLLTGSANFTRRNLQDYNLETNVQIVASASESIIQQADQLFEQIWTNANGYSYTVDYSVYKDESWLRYWLYRFMEASGFSTF